MSETILIEISPEPAPNFDVGREKWGVLWPMHYNTFGVLFLLLLIYAMDSVVALCKAARRFQRRKVFIVVNVLISFFCLISSMSILIDPYNSGEHIEKIKFRGILFQIISLKIPCLTSAFALIQISLLESTKMQLYSKRIQNFRFIGAVILVHFMVVITADLLLVFAANIIWLLICCQVLQFLIGLAICFSSIITGRKLIKTYCDSKRTICTFSNEASAPDKSDHLKDKSNELSTFNQNTSKSTTNTNINQGRKFGLKRNAYFKDKSVKKICWMAITTAILGILYCGCIVFSVTSVFMFNQKQPHVWNWFIMETMFRIIELLMAGIMAYTVRRSTNVLKKCCGMK